MNERGREMGYRIEGKDHADAITAKPPLKHNPNRDSRENAVRSDQDRANASKAAKS